MKKNSTIRKGKKAEFYFLAMLADQGFEVYTPIADDNGVDALVRLKNGKFAEIQIKSRAKDAKYPEQFAAIRYTPGRSNYWFAFHTWKGEEDSWHLISAKEFEKYARPEKDGTWAFNLKKNAEALKHRVLDDKSWDQFGLR